MLVESYEKPYFQLFCTVCDVIENVELFLENTALTGTQQQFLRKQIEQCANRNRVRADRTVETSPTNHGRNGDCQGRGA